MSPKDNYFGNIYTSKVKIKTKNKNPINKIKEYFYFKIENHFKGDKARNFRSNYFGK